MEIMEFKPAKRTRAKLRLGISGPSGAGKTYSALMIANGITPWTKIAIIDSENGSAELYSHLGAYSVLTLEPPYTPEKYIEAIRLAEKSGFEVVIIDSLSHCWNGEGGILDQQGKAAEVKFKGNTWAAWRDITPRHNALVETILKSSCHIIATLRSKTEYIQVSENGKSLVKKIGLAPVQRDGMEYEFTVFLDLSVEHIAFSSKDRTGVFDGQYFKPSFDTGKKLLAWLNCGEREGIQELEAGSKTEEQGLGQTNSVINGNEYCIIGVESKTKSSGQVFARLLLQGQAGKVVAWSADTEILEVPVGSMIYAELVQKNTTNIIESYVRKGEVAA